ncbi:unnamed protein product [Albugo candida]|uniref:Uncharacterized protein n=1 Tax=Albugo candida TaxID=65357 RepID=A0A024GI10_9STRA|nr:unnamed protein product [Albugo candida]|eukprot:CCI46385.1 unnamed protein product [Albugo candida]
MNKLVFSTHTVSAFSDSDHNTALPSSSIQIQRPYRSKTASLRQLFMHASNKVHGTPLYKRIRFGRCEQALDTRKVDISTGKQTPYLKSPIVRKISNAKHAFATFGAMPLKNTSITKLKRIRKSLSCKVERSKQIYSFHRIMS